MKNIINTLIYTITFILIVNPSYGNELTMKSQNMQFVDYEISLII